VSTERLPHLPETPWDALGPIVSEKVFVDGRTFVIRRPDESERLLDHPVIQSEFAVDEYMPYWADLWPAARMLAKVVLREPWPAGEEALELGCGLGLPGIAALAAGLRMTFSDCDATALRFAADNARGNGFADFRLLQLDWRYPPPDLCTRVILASDLVYELRNVEPLVAFVKQVLAPGGLCLLTDQDRVPAYTLREHLAAAGFAFTTQPVRAGAPGERRYKGTLYRITRPA
jgi:predicted nicotinamide N-methyase